MGPMQIIINNKTSNNMLPQKEDLPAEVAESYLHLRRLNKRHELLRYIDKVEMPGLFVWSDKKERLNGKRCLRWQRFYERFSNKNSRERVPEKDIRWHLPDLLPQYYEALQEAIRHEETKRIVYGTIA